MFVGINKYQIARLGAKEVKGQYHTHTVDSY